MADYLPNDLIVDILSRLPSKALLRCLSVCKSWRSLICSKEFRFMHLQNSNQKNPRNLVRRFDSEENREIYTVHCDDEYFTVDPGTPIEFPFRRNRHFMFYYRIVGCCNGVFCLSDDKCGRRGENIILWNPSIRRNVTVIPPLYRSSYWHEWFLVFGFGYDQVSDDFKVIRLSYDDFSFAKPQVEVYTVKTAIWRPLEFPDGFPSYSIFPTWSQVFINGYVHWVACDCAPVSLCSILTFDLNTELFGNLQLPEELVEESPMRMVVTVVRESLAVIYSSRRLSTYWTSSSTYMVWAMKEYNNPASWTMIYHMHYPNSDVGRALQLRNNGYMIMESRYGDLKMLDSGGACDHVYAACRGFMVHDVIYVDRYEESLALLDAGHDNQIDLRRNEVEPDEWYGDFWLPRGLVFGVIGFPPIYSHGLSLQSAYLSPLRKYISKVPALEDR